MLTFSALAATASVVAIRAAFPVSDSTVRERSGCARKKFRFGNDAKPEPNLSTDLLELAKFSGLTKQNASIRKFNANIFDILCLSNRYLSVFAVLSKPDLLFSYGSSGVVPRKLHAWYRDKSANNSEWRRQGYNGERPDNRRNVAQQT